jgi:predicted small secreted protein
LLPVRKPIAAVTMARAMFPPDPANSPEESVMKRTVALMFVALFSVAALSGCNTVNGFGKDVQKVGEKMEDASSK